MGTGTIQRSQSRDDIKATKPLEDVRLEMAATACAEGSPAELTVAVLKQCLEDLLAADQSLMRTW